MNASRLLFAWCAAVAACSSDADAPVETLVVGPTADTVIAPTANVTVGVPRSDGTWVLLAPEENQVLIADFADTVTRAHPGITSTAVAGPSALLGVGDTIVVGDWNRQQFSSWLPDGRMIASHPGAAPLGGAFPVARDAAGQWYFEVGPPPGVGGEGLKDSAAVVRTDSALTRFDTVARLTPGDLVQIENSEGARLSRRVLSGRDRWGVQRDGLVWVARVDQNFIEWFPAGDGKKGKGPRLPDPVYPVKEIDRQLYAQRFPEDYRPTALQVPFAAIKPPFEAVLAIGPGMWLLEKNSVGLDSVRGFQLVDRKGLLRRINLPTRGTALGFNGTHLLMAEQFPGGVRLLRYPIAADAVRARVE